MPAVPGLGPQRRLAAGLLSALLITGVTIPAASASPPQDLSGADPTPPLSVLETADPAPATPAGAMTGPFAVHLVEAGESLWSIAEDHLGDGARWREILDLNAGRVQVDGLALDPADPWIEIGWALTLPDPTHPAGPAATPGPRPEPAADAPEVELEVVVAPGDTLWGIAATYLGDGTRYPEIVAASSGIDQGNGVRLNDPDVIDVGWHLRIPAPSDAAAASDPTPQTTSQQIPAQPQPDPTPLSDQVQPPRPDEPTLSTQPETAGEVAAPRAAAAADPPQDEAAPVQAPRQGDTTTDTTDAADDVTAPVLAVGGMLAAGLVAALAWHRRHRLRSRSIGTRSRRPETASPAQRLEQELQQRSDPITRAVLDRTLRHLARATADAGETLPALRAVRLASDGSELHLYLAQPAQLPAPWTGLDSDQIWALRQEDLPDLLTDPEPPDTPAPYPALVTIGQDEDGAYLLLDLENLGQLDLGPDSESILTALALELATSEWTDDLQVTLLGGLADLPAALGSPRLHHAPAQEDVIGSVRRRLERLHEHGRTRRDTPDPWAAEILLLTGDQEEEQNFLRELTTTLPGLGVAAVTTHAPHAPWSLTPARDGWMRLEPAGILVKPQRVEPAGYAALLTMLHDVQEPTTGPDWATTLSRTSEPGLTELPSPVLHPTFPREGGAPEEAADALTPRLAVLGEVLLAGVDTSVLEHSPHHLSQAIELVAYIAFHPDVETGQLSRAMWPDREVRTTTRHSAISRARRLLGTDTEGCFHLPPTTSDPLGNTYRVQGLDTDWVEFNRLRGPDPTQTPLGDLRAALALVRGTPFSRLHDGRIRVRANRYLWADTLAYEITQDILDVAAETARRALLEGNLELATEATRAGLRASRDDERIWRYAIRTASLSGDTPRTDQLIADLTAHLSDLEVDPMPETSDLIAEITRAHSRRAS